jgi:hypothetical protein
LLHIAAYPCTEIRVVPTILFGSQGTISTKRRDPMLCTDGLLIDPQGFNRRSKPNVDAWIDELERRQIAKGISRPL